MSEVTLSKVKPLPEEVLLIKTNAKGGGKRGETKSVRVVKIDQSQAGNPNYIVTTDGTNTENLGGGTEVVK